MLTDELRDLQLDTPQRGKTPEQIERHTIDPTLENKPIERAFYLLTKGDEIQKISVIYALPQLLRVNSQAVSNRLIPKIQADLPNSSSEFNIAMSKIVKVLVEQKIPIDMLNAVFQGIESRDPVVSNAWFDTLIAIVPNLDASNIKQRVLPLVKEKSSLNQPLYHRIASCKLLGVVATHPTFSPFDVKKEVLPSAQSLCQDYHPEIRAALCMQLPNLIKSLIYADQISLLPCLIELSSDEKPNVACAGVTAIMGSITYVSEDTFTKTILPLVQHLYEKGIESVDSVTVILAKELGNYILKAEPFLNMQASLWYLGTFKTLSGKGKPSPIQLNLMSQDVLCREHCATNFPSVLKFALKKVPEKIDWLYIVFKGLASDPCYIVRRSIAERFHEVAELLGPKNNLIKPEFVNLLRDEVEEIVQALVFNVDITLENFMLQKYISKKPNENVMGPDIGNALLKCQIQLTRSNNWRLLTNFLNRLEYLTNCMPSDYIHQHFTPIILNIAVQGRYKPVRLEACRTLLWFLKNNAKETQKQWLRDNLISQLCYSSSFYTRQTFISMCSDALQIFPIKYFKDYFYIPLISLIDDRIANIRYGVVKLMPQLRVIITSQDAVLQKLYNNAITKLKTDEKDKDVKQLFEANRKDLEGPINLKAQQAMLQMERRKEFSQSIFYRRVSETGIISNEVASAENFPRGSSQTKLMRGSSTEIKSSRSSTSGFVPPLKEQNLSSARQTKNDLNFLEQHFYVDAGIVFPCKVKVSSDADQQLTSKATSGSDEIVDSDDSKCKASNAGSNITDDDKCKMRLQESDLIYKEKENDKLEAETSANKSKRHSSVYSASCLKREIKKVENRRSLNISVKENSKIPVCHKVHTSNKEVGQLQKVQLNGSVINKQRSSTLLYRRPNNDAEQKSSDLLQSKPADKLKECGNSVQAKLSSIPILDKNNCNTEKEIISSKENKESKCGGSQLPIAIRQTGSTRRKLA